LEELRKDVARLRKEQLKFAGLKNAFGNFNKTMNDISVFTFKAGLSP